MKVLIADKLAERTVRGLEELGAEARVEQGLSAEDLPGEMGDAEILVVRSTKVTAETIENAPNLALIIRAGAGVNTIDLEAASKRGIVVSNCPGKNTEAVAELAIGLIIACDRRIVDACADLRAGRWRKKEYGKASGPSGLAGRRLGILGFGSIGRAVARRAIGLEMEVIAWSRSLTPEAAEEAGVVRAETRLDVAGVADAVSVHLAATPETEHAVDAAFFDAMKAGSIFVNTSRGEIVDTAALRAAITEKSLRVGLDVFENEPSGGEAAFEDPELAESITATPHIAASSDQASAAIADEVVTIARAYAETGVPLHAVNLRARSEAPHNFVVRHYNRVGVLAEVLQELKGAGVNVEEMENTIFSGGETATCLLKLDDRPTDEVLDRIEAKEHIIRASLT